MFTRSIGFALLLNCTLATLTCCEVRGQIILGDDDHVNGSTAVFTMRLDPPFGDGITEFTTFLTSTGFDITRLDQVGTTIPTEIKDLTLMGPSPFGGGPLFVRIGANNSIDSVPLATLGHIDVLSQTPGTDRDAFQLGNSFFDVFFEVDIPTLGMTLYNRQSGLPGGLPDDGPHHLTAPLITELPPNGSEHFPFGAPPFVNLYWQQNPAGRQGSDPRVGIAFGTHKLDEVVPEPSSLALVGLGCVGLIGGYRRSHKRQQTH